MTSVYIDPPDHLALKRLSEETRVPVAAYLREAISDLLAKYKVTVRKARAKQ
jgi:hypothetical protein